MTDGRAVQRSVTKALICSWAPGGCDLQMYVDMSCTEFDLLNVHRTLGTPGLRIVHSQ